MQNFLDLFKYDNKLIVAKYSSNYFSKYDFNYIVISLNHDNSGLSWIRGILKRRKFIYFKDIEDVITSYQTVNIIIKKKNYIFKFPTNTQALIFYKGINEMRVSS
jgi:hypothetical protein